MSRSALLPNHAVAIAAEAGRVNPTLVVQRNKGWAKVHEEARCRMCLRSRELRPLTRHHVVPLSYFRRHPKLSPLRHADANIVGLCEPCHRLVEAPRTHARVELRRVLSSTEIAFAIQVAGRVWLDERYPTRPPSRSATRPTPVETDEAAARRLRYRTQARRVWREGLR